MRGWFLAAVLGVVAPAVAQAGPVVQVEYSNPALVPAHWTLEIKPDGTGHFHSDRGVAAREDGQTIEAASIDRDVQLSPGFTERVFKIARHKKLFRYNCESHLNVAYQGTKKFSYTGPDGQGMCEFNYSKDPDIQDLGDSMQSVATTLIEGARLQMFLQHDRLGLDRETEILTESAADGRAIQIGSIRDILQRLAEDNSVMERVRRRARALLAKAEN